MHARQHKIPLIVMAQSLCMQAVTAPSLLPWLHTATQQKQSSTHQPCDPVHACACGMQVPFTSKVINIFNGDSLKPDYLKVWYPRGLSSLSCSGRAGQTHIEHSLHSHMGSTPVTHQINQSPRHTPTPHPTRAHSFPAPSHLHMQSLAHETMHAHHHLCRTCCRSTQPARCRLWQM